MMTTKALPQGLHLAKANKKQREVTVSLDKCDGVKKQNEAAPFRQPRLCCSV